MSSIPLSIRKCKPKLLTHRYLSKYLSCIDILHVVRSFCEYYENQFVNVNNAYWQTIQRFHFGISLQGDIINPSHRCYLPTVNIPFCQSFITFRFKGFKSFITFGRLLRYSFMTMFKWDRVLNWSIETVIFRKVACLKLYNTFLD